MRKLVIYTFLLIISLIIIYFIVFLNKIKYEKITYNNTSDGIAVLTGGKGRINLGLELFSSNSNLQLIISGVDKKVSDKSILPDNLKNSTHITVDKEAESTFQNAKVINKWARKNKLKNITIITSYYHMPRSMFLVQSLTPVINFYPYPVKKFISYKSSYKESIFYYFFLTEEYIKYLLSHFIIFIK